MRQDTCFQQATAFQLIPSEDGVFFEQDGRTRFCLNAPKATSLAVSLPGGPCWPLKKGEDGRWRGTLELEGGFRYVDILMNGETVLLPQLPIGFGYSRTVNFLDVPAKEDGYYQLQDVPHGSVARHYYPSTVTGNTESCLIYCPPDSEGRPLPILYLQHGLGENETGWVHQGRINFIMDNLLAQGRVRPMRIVMGNGMVQIDGGISTSAFPRVLVQDLIPYAESAYPTMKGKWNRAVAGLSMGSMHASAASMTHPELFGYVGLFSGFMRMLWENEQPHLKALDDPEAFSRNYRVFFRAMGDRDEFFSVFEEDDRLLASKGVQVMRKVYDGKHEWQVWRECARDFLPLLFQ